MTQKMNGLTQRTSISNNRMKFIFLKLPLYLILSLFCIHCSTYLINKKPSSIRKKISPERKISYELIGWVGKDNKQKANQVLETLHVSNAFQEVSVSIYPNLDLKIQIIFESSPEIGLLFNEPKQALSWLVEKDPTRYTLYLMNRILSASSRLLFPIFQVSGEILTFRVWKGNELLEQISYPIEKLRIFGWVSLILIPFDDRKEIKSLYEERTLQFLIDSKSIYSENNNP